MRWLTLLWLGALMLFAGGCGGPPAARTTFLRSVDLVDMTDQMAQSFARDDTIGARTPDAPEWVISIDKLVNLTNQIIPDGEKWLYLARLRAKLAEADVARERHIVWVIPPERWSIVASEFPDQREPYGLRRDPTHLMTAEFRALTRTSGAGRSDYYVCAYQLVDLRSGELVWENAWEVKRAVSGRTYD